MTDSLTAGTSRTRVFRRAPRGWFSALLMIDHPRSTGERPLHAHPQLSVMCRIETVVDSGCSLRRGWGLRGDLYEGPEGAHSPSRTLYSPQPLCHAIQMSQHAKINHNVSTEYRPTCKRLIKHYENNGNTFNFK